METEFRELQNEMLSVTHDIDGVHSQYVHPGFGNVDTPNVVVFEEAPSLGHFTNRSEDIGSMNIREYVNYFEGEYRDRLLNWPPYKDFLGPVFAEFGISRDSLLDETYMASVVKNPIKTKNKSSNLRNVRGIWKSYVKRELEFLEPDIVITAGRPASNGFPHYSACPLVMLDRSVSQKSSGGDQARLTHTHHSSTPHIGVQEHTIRI